MSRKTQQMIYTRPSIITEAIRLTAVRCGPYLVHYAIFDEDEAQERLASGFWVDHPKKITELDEAIAEAAEKEAKAKKLADDETQAETEKREMQDKIDAVQVAEGERKLIHSTEVPNPDDMGIHGDKDHHEGETVITGENQPDHTTIEPLTGDKQDAPETVKDDTKKVEQPKVAKSAAKDGQKVDGQKVENKKAK